MSPSTDPQHPPYRVYSRPGIHRIKQLQGLGANQILALKTVSAVLPFRVNDYVIENLIDWENVPNDPMYQLAFPQEGMLSPTDFKQIRDLVHSEAPPALLSSAVDEVRGRLNPHPGGQLSLNVPQADGVEVPGMQHKYRETVLFFPSRGQTCHTYCTYCFRWAQFVGDSDLRFASNDTSGLVRYLNDHPDVTDVLLTGGDPLTMGTKALRRYVEPLLSVPTLSSIRIGTKSVAWWPYRFLPGEEGDDLLRLFEEVIQRGKHLALMAHYSHPRELSTSVATAALSRILSTGAAVRCQAPLVRHVNDSAEVWSDLWSRQVRAGAIPYYMFVERDTGPQEYFKVPLARALSLFQTAYGSVSGLARTVRGPTMSCTPGKLQIVGSTELDGERFFVLRVLQGRDPKHVNQILFAHYDEDAAWFGDLRFRSEVPGLTPQARGRQRFLPTASDLKEARLVVRQT